LVASVFVYVGVAMSLPQRPLRQVSPSLFVAALVVVAALQGLATLWLRQSLLVAPARAGRLDLDSEAGAQRLFRVALICFVLSESVAIYGLVCVVLVGSWSVALGFVAAGLALLAVHAPRLAPLRPPAGSADLPHRPDPIG